MHINSNDEWAKIHFLSIKGFDNQPRDVHSIVWVSRKITCIRDTVRFCMHFLHVCMCVCVSCYICLRVYAIEPFTEICSGVAGS